MHLAPALALLVASSLVAAACTPQTAPRRTTARPAEAPAAAVKRPPVDARPGERPKRTGLHPELFEENSGDAFFEETRVEPTPTATASPTPETTPDPNAPAAEPTPEPPPAESLPATGESLAPLIAGATAPNVAAALRLVEQGRQQLNDGRSDAAIGPLERAVAIDPTNVQGYYYLGVLHFERGSYAQAIAFANRAVVLANSGDATWSGWTYQLQGTIYEKVGRYPDARAAYERAVARDPGNSGARAGLYRLGGEREDAAAP